MRTTERTSPSQKRETHRLDVYMEGDLEIAGKIRSMFNGAATFASSTMAGYCVGAGQYDAAAAFATVAVGRK
jgi:hypothetical protein